MPAYWLGAFFNPRGLLALLKQDAYRHHGTDRSGNIEQYVFQTEITARDKDHVSISEFSMRCHSYYFQFDKFMLYLLCPYCNFTIDKSSTLCTTKTRVCNICNNCVNCIVYFPV